MSLDPDLAASDDIVASIGIPPCPSTLQAIQGEIAKETPDLRRVAQLVSRDVALTATLLRVVNSPAYGLRRKCETIEQSIALLGLKQVNAAVIGILLRAAVRGDAPQLTRFWDVSSKRSTAMRLLANELGGVEADAAQLFGLFCDVGIPLLMRRFPDYSRVLVECNSATDRSFTDIEQQRLNTDHALVGSLMARTWGVARDVSSAIRVHHDYSIFHDRLTPEPAVRLVAMGLLSEVAIQRFGRMNGSREWDKASDHVAGALLLSDQDIKDWIEVLIGRFVSDDA